MSRLSPRNNFLHPRPLVPRLRSRRYNTPTSSAANSNPTRPAPDSRLIRKPPPRNPQLRPNSLEPGNAKCLLRPKSNVPSRTRNLLPRRRLPLHQPGPLTRQRRLLTPLGRRQSAARSPTHHHKPHNANLPHPQFGPALQMPHLAHLHRWRGMSSFAAGSYP